MIMWFLRAGVTPSRLNLVARHPGSDRPLGMVAGRIGFEIDGSVGGFFVTPREFSLIARGRFA
jgi:hypothetical protein